MTYDVAIRHQQAEAGAGSRIMPWHHDGSAISRPVDAGTGKAYRGSNILSLWIAAQAAGYSSGRWASYRQWQALGAQVRKGEQATTIVFWKINQRGEDADDGDHELDGRGRPDHAAYIASWLKVLKADARAIFTLASKAQAAADWMQMQQPEPVSVAA